MNPLFRVSVVILLGLCASGASAQTFPVKPIRIVVPFSAGGPTDLTVRAMGPRLTELLGKAIVVDNRAGATGIIGAEIVAKAPPDGYTLLAATASVVAINMVTYSKLPFSTLRDFQPLTPVMTTTTILVVHPSVPAKSLKELVALANARPGQVTMGSAGTGGTLHLALEMLIKQAAVNMTHVPFSGWGESSPALLGGHIEGLMAQPGEVKPLVDGGKMRVLMVSQVKRHAAFPDAPSARELGWGTDTPSGAWFAFVAPKGTPGPVQRTIHDAVKAAMEDPQFVNTIKQRVIDVDYRAGDQLRADLWKEYKSHGEILARLGMIKKK